MQIWFPELGLTHLKTEIIYPQMQNSAQITDHYQLLFMLLEFTP